MYQAKSGARLFVPKGSFPSELGIVPPFGVALAPTRRCLRKKIPVGTRPETAQKCVRNNRFRVSASPSSGHQAQNCLSQISRSRTICPRAEFYCPLLDNGMLGRARTHFAILSDVKGAAEAGTQRRNCNFYKIIACRQTRF